MTGRAALLAKQSPGDRQKMLHISAGYDDYP
jgi:hypothetical protein